MEDYLNGNELNPVPDEDNRNHPERRGSGTAVVTTLHFLQVNTGTSLNGKKSVPVPGDVVVFNGAFGPGFSSDINFD